MSTPPATRAEQQVQTRERLIDAAARVFARRGYHAATLAEVAREAGYSTGAVYSNFSGKEDLFLALADRQVAGRGEQARAIAELAPEDPWADGGSSRRRSPHGSVPSPRRTRSGPCSSTSSGRTA